MLRWEWSPKEPIVCTSGTLFSSWVQSYLETCSNFDAAVPFLGSGTVRLSTLEPHRPASTLRRHLVAALSLLLWEQSSPRRDVFKCCTRREDGVIPSSCTFKCGNIGLCDKSSSAQPQRSMQNSRSRSPRIPCLACSRPITGLISPSDGHLHKPRRAQRHKHKWKPKVRTQKGHLFWPLPELSQESPRCIVQAWNASRWVNSRATFRLNSHGLREMGHIMACRGRASGDKTTYGMCRQEPHAGKGMDLSDLGGTRVGK